MNLMLKSFPTSVTHKRGQTPDHFLQNLAPRIFLLDENLIVKDIKRNNRASA